jgi:pimeloyl-ACP methyl ester carboxylesterase
MFASIDLPSSALGTELGSTRFGPFTIRWTEVGPRDAPRVLLLHGVYAGAHSYEWRRLVPVLAQRFRVRVPDLLGAGASDRPNIEYTPEVLTGVVSALIRDTGHNCQVVASSLTAAHAVRAVRDDAPAAALTLITPTGLGRRRPAPPRWIGSMFELLRSTPVGNLLLIALTSSRSVRWFQTHRTYRDPGFLDDEELRETKRAGRERGAKHLQLAFVFDRLSIEVDHEVIGDVAPTVIWATGQRFTDNAEADAWRAAGAAVVEVDSGLPQVEDPAGIARVIALVHDDRY